jgi:protein TonB
MSDRRPYSSSPGARRPSPALLPALLFSLTAHAAAGSLLLNDWQRLPVEPPPPLTVTLEAVMPPAVKRPLPRIQRNHLQHASNRHPAPALPLHHAPKLVPVTVERVVPAPAIIVAPTPESAAAPAIAATATAALNASGRADAIEPPHFNVAYLSNPLPAYPPLARKLGIEGVVVLRVQVSVAGAPGQVAVAQTSGAPVLDEAALKAVQGWTFVPARRGDTPIAHSVDVPIRFELRN